MLPRTSIESYLPRARYWIAAPPHERPQPFRLLPLRSSFLRPRHRHCPASPGCCFPTKSSVVRQHHHHCCCRRPRRRGRSLLPLPLPFPSVAAFAAVPVPGRAAFRPQTAKTSPKRVARHANARPRSGDRQTFFGSGWSRGTAATVRDPTAVVVLVVAESTTTKYQQRHQRHRHPLPPAAAAQHHYQQYRCYHHISPQNSATAMRARPAVCLLTSRGSRSSE